MNISMSVSMNKSNDFKKDYTPNNHLFNDNQIHQIKNQKETKELSKSNIIIIVSVVIFSFILLIVFAVIFNEMNGKDISNLKINEEL